MTEFNQILNYEKDIFRVFSQSQHLKTGEAFVTPRLSQEPHWNLFYPDFINKPNIEEVKAFYEEHKVQGHILYLDENEQDNRVVVEKCVYFKFDKPSLKNKSSILAQVTHDLDLFSELVAQIFSYDEATKIYFAEQMHIINESMPSVFILFKCDQKICGTASLFQVSSNESFLFNFGVLPEFRNQGLSVQMLHSLLQEQSHQIYTYSENQAMCDVILPRAQFKEVGTSLICKLDHRVI